LDPRYTTARSAPPVQIPDDLSPPDENDAIRLPPDVGSSTAAPSGCLENPPSFFGESQPFRRSADSDDREQPSAEAETPVATPAPAPAGDDRVIAD
jgi:hypothetical protein